MCGIMVAPGKGERVWPGRQVCVRPQLCPCQLWDLEMFPDLSVPGFPTLSRRTAVLGTQ